MLRGRALAEDVRDEVRAAVNILKGYCYSINIHFLQPLHQCVTCHKKRSQCPIRIKSSVSQTGSQSSVARVYGCVYFRGLVIDAHTHTIVWVYKYLPRDMRPAE